MSIRPIPHEVIAQLKSSAAIINLNGVVSELMKNSLDAAATRIEISVDYSRGDCIVEDDGFGIPTSDFADTGGLGKLYHTSKSNQKNTVHGNHGTFLASLSAMALITITSHHHLHRSHNTLHMHKSEIVSRQTPAPAQQYLASSDHGTRVTVRNLFGGMPVRVKQRALTGEKHRGYSKDWEELKSHAILLLLAWPKKVYLTIKRSELHQKMVIRPLCNMETSRDGGRISPSAVGSILSQAGYITPDQKASWVPVSASTPHFQVDGSISIEPCATKNLQFISLGILPVFGAGSETVLHEEINRLFLNSNFGNDEEATDVSKADSHRKSSEKRSKESGFTKRDLAGGRKGVERWPMFYIKVHRSDRSQYLDNDGIDLVLNEYSNSIGPILELLRTIVLAFLSKHHFRPRDFREESFKSKREAIDDTSNRTSEQLQPISNNGSTKPPIPEMTSSVQVQDKSSIQSPTSSHRHIEQLGSGVKMPYFRRSLPSVETPFNSWSRVKSGSAKAVFDKQKDSKSITAASMDRHGGAAPRWDDHGRELSNTPIPTVNPAQSTTSLLSKSGKLMRPPFEDVIAQQTTSKPRSPPELSLEQAQAANEKVVWVNPATKVRSVLDTRTGLTVPENLASNTPALEGSDRRISRSKLRKVTTTTLESPGPWISDVLKNWENPVYQACEQTIPQISFGSCGNIGDELLHNQQPHCNHDLNNRESTGFSPAISERISKEALEKAQVISQVDKKFVLLKVESSSSSMSSDHRRLLVIVDQHAADERIRIERLMEELCAPSRDSGTSLQSTSLGKPITFEVPSTEVDLLRTHICHFAKWGIIYAITDPEPTKLSALEEATNTSYHLVVRSLPPGIVERCKLDPKVLIELIRNEVWKVSKTGSSPPKSGLDARRHQTWIDQIHGCPQGILDLLNSRACRSAIMFNDELSMSQCETLISKLAECTFPFQCAHGRPSMVPLVELGHDTKAALDIGTLQVSKSQGFGTQFRHWRLAMSGAHR